MSINIGGVAVGEDSAPLIIAEMFYKFGSFGLECLAFLATWWLVSGIWFLALGAVENRSSRNDRGSA